MTDLKKYNDYLYQASSLARRNLLEIQKKIEDIYTIEEMQDYAEIPDNPVEYALAALRSLIGQVNDFQDYAETVTGKMVLDLDEVNLYDMLDSVLTIADQLIETKSNVTLEEDIEDDLPEIEGDMTRLTQALLNLIHNAVKFTDEGKITVRVSREAENILFEVQDTGIGIAEADQEKVFEPFETILDDKDDPRLGFGIGLKIVEHIVDLHDGETWFESKPGVGSSFCFTIPVS